MFGTGFIAATLTFRPLLKDPAGLLFYSLFQNKSGRTKKKEKHVCLPAAPVVSGNNTSGVEVWCTSGCFMMMPAGSETDSVASAITQMASLVSGR